MPKGPSKGKATLQAGTITATSQQSRFHTETLDAGLELDLQGVTISIGEHELITDSRLKLKGGVRYGLIGRNGSGKSTLLQAIADKLIPGISSSLRILFVSQVMDSARAATFEDGNDEDVSVLQHVIGGDKQRLEAVKEFDMLTRAVESTNLGETQCIVSSLRLAKYQRALDYARKIASRTSGTRGKKAREEEIRAEDRLKAAKEALEQGTVDVNVLSQAADMLLDVTTTLEILDAATAESRAATILAGLGFSQEMVKSPYVSLSGGWRSRCALATSLLVQSDILILDEPSNFMDLAATLWLEQYLVSRTGTLILTSHDQVFLNHVVEETIHIRHKTLRYFEGTPHAYDVNERKRYRAAKKSQDVLNKKKEHIESSIRQGVASAKQTGDENRMRMVKSRQKKLDERWGVETSAKGGRFKLNRDLAGFHETSRAEVTVEEAELSVKIVILDPDKLRTLGDLVHLENVSFRYPNAVKPTLEGVTLTVDQGGRCAFVGANGQGKSTLSKLILGELSPTRGSITRHPLLKIGYFSQHSVEELSGSAESTALTYFLDHFAKKGDTVSESDARRCLGSFGLGGKIASDTPLGALSGGQKVRLAFALIVFRPPSLLLLDEVTTHVDAPTIQALAIALRHFSGGVILVTHDRWFSRVVVEGCSANAAASFDHEDIVSDMSDDTDAEQSTSDTHRQGLTYYVGSGRVKLLENGMMQYVQMVERGLERRTKAAEAAAAKGT